MSFSTSMKNVLVTTSILSLASQALGHMEMSWPYPLHSKYNPANSYNVIDYSMTSPLVADGSNFPCKGYQNDRPFVPVITYEAGSQYNMTLAGSAVHGGGSCQLSLSYDNGATFRVIKSMMGGCPLTPTYDFTIPSYAPDGNALFAWSWQNEQGNREFYMNCAQVSITGGDDSSKFNSLPFMWKANLAGINDCTTAEGEDPVYPHPGPEVQYGGAITSSSPAHAGTCDAPTPFGQTYKDLKDTAEPQTGSSGGSVPTSVQSSSPSSYSAASSSVPTTLQSVTRQSAASSAAASSAKVTFSSVKAGVTHPTTATTAAPAPTSTGSDDGDDGDDGEDTCGPDVTMTVYSGASSSAAATAAPSSGSGSPHNDPDSEYATGDLKSYLPCVPGTYICTSSNAWVTCDSAMYSDGSTSWVYRDSRTLGNGAVCVPSFSPYSSSTKQYAQQADSPAGYYRDDRIAYSTGNSCSENGDIQCQGSGGFNMCADTVWYQMGSTAPGTSCANGDLVVS